MEFEEYERLAALLKESRKIIMNKKRTRPKNSTINRHHDKALKHITALKYSLDEMLCIEHPDKAESNIFYGPHNKDFLIEINKEE